MKGKIFKSLAALSLVLTLSTSNFVYADPDPESSAADPEIVNEEQENVNSSKAYDVFADEITESLKQYAVDIFHDRKMIFHYRAAHTYDTDTLAPSSGSTSGLLTDEEEETCAHDYDKAREGKVDGTTVIDPDTNPEGAWFGFNGVNNRIAVFNRSNDDVDMRANSDTVENGLTLNLFLNGDGIGNYAERKLNVTSGKTLPDSERTFEACELYSTSERRYTPDMGEFLKYTQAFVPVTNPVTNDDGGRFAALSSSDEGIIPIEQDGSANLVTLAAHSLDEQDHHMLGYALLYFDVSGKPSNQLPAYPAASNADATKIGVITLTFSAHPEDVQQQP